ncbi:uncharacterized protein LOC130718025 isoform X2 [Lotus japonicus]|uniref:uncharacterized protein LOC130718025 isoform X2 n=1 Tax=Lotus japonicus TaxID=34305 RepID=UPI00258AF880|nr:uncharacterized protein LOC130718025 isoform X2 [Lotus japonicus]
MVIADSDYEGPAIEALGSLFKITQVFLWDDGLQLPLSTQQSKFTQEPHDDDAADPLPDWSDLILPEDLELNKEMNELGLPLSFQTTKQKCGTVKGKRKGARSKQQHPSHDPVAETLYEANVEEVASLAEFHDKTNSSISCISILGQSESSYCDGAVEVDMTHCASGEGELESLPTCSEGSGCDRIDGSNYCSEHGEWMVLWDTFYKRRYFYNVTTDSSTWDPPPGMEHLAIGGSTESDDNEALKSAEDHGTQNNNEPPDETWIEENASGKPHEGYSAQTGVAAGNFVFEMATNNEDQSIDHSDENFESSCNDGVSCCSVLNALDHIISSNGRYIQEEPEVDHTPMENMVIDISELDTESDPSTSRKEKKTKKIRRQKQRKLYNETEDLHFQNIPEAYSATIGKYWCQRYILFSRFDDGVKMDEEGWFSVTPEAVARYQSIRCASSTIIDCFAGVGGNAIQFTQRCGHVIAIDIDPLKIDYARHNASIYGVDDQIEFIIGDFFLLAPKLKADTVFLSPPWGGPDYAKVATYDMKTMLRPHDGYTLFHVAKEIAPRVVMFLPKNINFNQLAELCLSACPPWSLEVEKVHLNGKLKAITAYFSDTAVGGC